MQQVHRDKELEVSEVKKLTEDSYAVRFKLNNFDFNYFPGQFVMLKFDPLIENGEFKVLNDLPKTQSRAYSMSSSPLNKDFLEITSKRTPDGFISDYMARVLGPGHIVKVSGPYGKFVFDENSNEDIFLIGAGSGISPLMSMLRYIIEKNFNKNVTMLFSNKRFSDVIWYDELMEIQDKYKTFKCYFTLTQKDHESWDGFEGRINSNLIKNCNVDLMKQIFYICGPPLMVDATVKDLKELGVDESKIKIEKYE